MSVDSKIRIPESALQELEEVEQMDWEDGRRVEGLDRLDQPHRGTIPPRPERSSAPDPVRSFTLRSFRHYQTMGCIDAPKRAGKSVTYGFKHYLQGLVIRKLLWEKMPSEQITTLMAGKDTGELKRLLLEGIEIVAAGGSEKEADGPCADRRRHLGGSSLPPGWSCIWGSSRRTLSKQERRGSWGRCGSFCDCHPRAMPGIK